MSLTYPGITATTSQARKVGREFASQAAASPTAAANSETVRAVAL